MLGVLFVKISFEFYLSNWIRHSFCIFAFFFLDIAINIQKENWMGGEILSVNPYFWFSPSTLVTLVLRTRLILID